MTISYLLINTHLLKSDILHLKNNKNSWHSKKQNKSKPLVFIARDQSRITSHLTDRAVPRLY